MTAIVPWLRKLSLARDAKVVKLILGDAIKELTQAAESRVYLFAESDASEAHPLTKSLISLCHQKKSLFYLSHSDDTCFREIGLTPELKEEPVLVIPIRLENPIGVVLSFFAENSSNRLLKITRSFDEDKCVILTEASAIALENVVIHAELSGQIAERTAELVEVKQAADTANRIKSRYLSAASHDLRQPLQQLTSLLNVMTRQSGEQNSLSNLKKMQRITSGMDKLLSRLLHLEQLEQGAINPKPGPIALNELLAVVEEDFSQKATDKGLKLSVEQSNNYVISDYDLLLQIIRNLVGNAIKYTNKGSIRIYTESADDFVSLFVIDTGPGISADQQQLVFDPFYQIPDGRQQSASFGLGLSLVKALAETLAVPIMLNSEPEQGTEFRLTLPVSKVQIQELASTQQALVQAESAARADILYLEDDEILIESFTILLEMVGFSVKTARSRLEITTLLQEASGYTPDVIVTDKNLENGDDGIEMVQYIRARLSKPELPAILLTGYTESTVVQTAMGTVQKVLSKPVDIDILIAAIEALID